MACMDKKTLRNEARFLLGFSKIYLIGAYSDIEEIINNGKDEGEISTSDALIFKHIQFMKIFSEVLIMHKQMIKSSFGNPEEIDEILKEDNIEAIVKLLAHAKLAEAKKAS